MTEPMDRVTEGLVERYLGLSRRARAKATVALEDGHPSMPHLIDMLSMSDDYVSDAVHFLEQGQLVLAYGALNYAHAWIDAAVRIGWLDGHDDDVLFTLPKDVRARPDAPGDRT